MREGGFRNQALTSYNTLVTVMFRLLAPILKEAPTRFEKLVGFGAEIF